MLPTCIRCPLSVRVVSQTTAQPCVHATIHTSSRFSGPTKCFPFPAIARTKETGVTLGLRSQKLDTYVNTVNTLCFTQLQTASRSYRRLQRVMPSPMGTMLTLMRVSASSLAFRSRSARAALSPGCGGGETGRRRLEFLQWPQAP